MKRAHITALAAAALALAAIGARSQSQSAADASGSAAAQMPSASSPASAPARNNAGLAALGATLATQGASGVAPCSSCHGAQGEGQAAAGFPRIAGQSAAYLERQLNAYAENYRSNPVMQPIAKAMTPEQRAAAAQHYANLAPAAAAASAPAANNSNAAANSAGRSLATVGAKDRTLQACANCHGPQGIGEMATYPALAGQHASYLKNALAEWKDGSRRTDPSGQMPRIARLLTDAEVNSLASYFASLPPPAPIREGTAVASRGGQTIVSGPTQAGANQQHTEGTGTEQGSPLSGGTQGVGGPGNPAGPRSGAPNSTTGAAASAPSGR